MTLCFKLNIYNHLLIEVHFIVTTEDTALNVQCCKGFLELTFFLLRFYLGSYM